LNSTNIYINSIFKRFKTSNKYYLYDANTNNIFEINKIIYGLIEPDRKENEIVIKREKVEKLAKYYPKKSIIKEIERLRNFISKELCFSSNKPDISFGINSIKNLYNQSYTRQLLLEVTQNCNQRCMYCAFSGRYYFNKRKHSKIDMPFYVAKKSIDFFLNRIPNDSHDNFSISFYGGEPLLKWDLLKQIISYIKKNRKNREIDINFTTNATLLTSEMIEYFIDNDVHMTISLDGPQQIHDRYRVFRNGKGTFNVVMDNLKKIKRISNDYFNRNVNYNIILAPPCNMEIINDFFYKNPFFTENQNLYNFSQVDVRNTSFFTDFNLEKEELKRINNVAKLNKKYNKFLIEGKYQKLTFEKKLFDSNFHKIHFREMKMLGNTYPVHGYCYPGLRKLFVDVHGNSYMCERVGNNFKIGDINRGFDFKKINEFFSKSEEFFADCKNCWALRLCSKCFNSINKGDSFDEKSKIRFCKTSKVNIERNLKYYCEIRESNFNAFEHLKKIVYK